MIVNFGLRKNLGSVEYPNFWLPFTDSGSGAVNLTLSRGTGSATFTRAGATATTVLSNGNVSSVIAANTARSYYDPTTLAYLGYIAEEARTNRCLHNGDKSNVAWVKTNCTISAATGADGTSRNVRVTATAGNATILQSITDASVARIYSAMVKRVTGTGNIDITIDGGATWTTISGSISSGIFTTVSRTQTLANPQVGFRIVTNGDAVDIDFDQEETGTFSTTRIPTGAASVTRAADVLTYPSAGNLIDASGTVFCKATSFWATASATSYLVATNASGRFIYNSGGVATTIQNFDGTTIGAASGTSHQNRVAKLATTWSGATKTSYFDSVAGAPSAYDGTFITGDLAVCTSNGGGVSWNGTCLDLRGWTRELSASQIASIR